MDQKRPANTRMRTGSALGIVKRMGDGNLEIDEVRCGPDSELPGRVVLEFGNIALSLTSEQARELAFALMTQSDQAERSAS
jgi:hypothetical protein